MIKSHEVKGAIYDIDGTLLAAECDEIGGLHDHSRLVAIQHVAYWHDITALQDLTAEENRNAFYTAKFSSLDGAVWSALYQKGIVDSDDLDPQHALLREIVDLKNEIHADIMRQFGKTVLGAVELVQRMASICGPDKLAIASSAVRRDINILVDEMTDWRQFFPPERIVSHDDVEHGFGSRIRDHLIWRFNGCSCRTPIEVML